LSLLEEYQGREDLLRLTGREQAVFCQEIRDFLVDSVSRTGGHLASNLGVVELTVALHKVFDFERDRLVFDVGHQAYVHKLLTGRKDGFATLRQFGGMAGFPKPSESDTDAFIAGHASNSVSVALGMARARTIQHEKYSVIALLGDGALTGGLSYEGLNDAGQSGEPLIVILNDNGMSISKNVGGVSRHLARLRLKPRYFRLKKAYRSFTSHAPGGKQLYDLTHRVKKRLKNAFLGSTVFEEMGFTYLGPVDGHDIDQLTYLLRWARELACPVLLHVSTTKGKGYPYAEQNPDAFHGVGKFDPATGEIVGSGKMNFSKVMGLTLVQMGDEQKNLCAVTAAMGSGTGLDAFGKAHPRRFYDVGIAEGHAVAMAAGLAKQGMIPVVAIYSTFLQRAFDMLVHDVAILGLHVVLCVDRAGLVGEDGETHHGQFDVGYLRQLPNFKIFCPATFDQLKQMLRQAVAEETGPVAIRYPRGGEGRLTGLPSSPVLREGRDVTLVSYGVYCNQVLDAADRLAANGVEAEVLCLPVIKPLDTTLVAASVRKTGMLLVAEDTAEAGSVGQALVTDLARQGVRGTFLTKNLGDRFIPHGAVETLYRAYGLDGESLCNLVLEVRTHEK
jgi:1-deoxy-D-xylulose-5-phosphate synthase